MRVSLSALALVVMATAGVSAENPRREKFRQLDANHDGKLTRSEFSGHPGNFRAMDCDDDRLVNEAEYVDPYKCDGATPDAFASADPNHDGVVTRDEWRGSPDEFARLDRNNDGRVTREEHAQPLAPDSPEGRFQAKDTSNDGVLSRREWVDEDVSFQYADGNGDGVVTLREYVNQPRADYPDEPFADLDHNRDGLISREEWHADTASFDGMDRDRDGFVSSREFVGPGRAVGRLDARFRELDRDRDGAIGWTEWDGDDEAFRLLDANDDGVVSRSEFRSTQALTRRFSRLDHDRTGDLSQEEWPGDRTRFAQLDRNRDGLVSRDEYLYYW